MGNIFKRGQSHCNTTLGVGGVMNVNLSNKLNYWGDKGVLLILIKCLDAGSTADTKNSKSEARNLQLI